MKNERTTWKSLDGQSSTEIVKLDNGCFLLRYTAAQGFHAHAISRKEARGIADALNYLKCEGLITGGVE